MTNQKVGPFPVLEVTQKGGSFFTASIPAEELTAITHSDVRRLVHEDREVERYLGIQRPLNKDRVREIRQYILSPDPTFPTAVIVASPRRFHRIAFRIVRLWLSIAVPLPCPQ